MPQKYYQSPRWSNEIADCSMPMTFDTYSNCSFGCLYCFSQFQRAVGDTKEAYLHKDVRNVSVNHVKKMFSDPDQYGGQFKEYIKDRKVMQWGGLSDQFDGFERKNGVTLELLKFFKEIDYPLCFSTKSTWFTEDERYMELIRGQKNWNFKFSIITLDEQKAHIIEKGVPSPVERLKAIERIAKADAGGATLRLRPFIIGVSTPTYLNLIREAANLGASAMSTEFFCVEQRSPTLKSFMPTFNELCGFDVMEFYRKYSVSSGYLRLNRKVKEPFLRNMKNLCEEVGMRFYVSDAHFKEMCCNGSCCGLPSDWNYSRGQWCEALQIAKINGVVRYSDVKGDIEKLVSSFQWIRAQGFNCNSSERRAKFEGMTMADYMRWLWNNPQAGQSPYKLFEGILRPVGKDDCKDLIYQYTGKD
nr:MAG TPA: DNA repair photolyase [Caudoviricetes sp.]